MYYGRVKLGATSPQLKVRGGFREGGIPTLETLLECEEGEDERSGQGGGNSIRRIGGEAECVVMETDGWTRVWKESWRDEALTALKQHRGGAFSKSKGNN